MKTLRLCIDANCRLDIARAITRAQSNRVTLDQIKAIRADPASASLEMLESMRGQAITIPDGWLCLYTEDEQPIGLVRHLCVVTHGPYASEKGVQIIMGEFGFTCGLNAAAAVYHKIEDDCIQTHVMELIRRDAFIE